MTTPNDIDLVNAALAREAKEAQRGERDARQDIARIVRRQAMKAASPAGLAALFPGLKKGK